MMKALGVLLLAGAAAGQTIAECQRCIDRGDPCFKMGWSEPCYKGGGSASVCEGNQATWCPSMGGTSPSNPVPPAPAPVPPGPSAKAGHDSRLVAYVGNWQTCPTDEQVNAYTHILVSFAVTYTWVDGGKNTCNQQCQITAPTPVCNNAPQPELVSKWKAAGKKVILSFGGGQMGGSWDGLNDCWEYCYGKEAFVVQQLVDIARDQNFDGVDIDYEYYYEDGQRGSSFAKGAQAQAFLKDVTIGLRQSLPTGSEVTHAPMDIDLVRGTGYYNIIKEVASSLDFVMPQYYNGVTQPSTEGLRGGPSFVSALGHFTTLVTDCFKGDPTKVVFGFSVPSDGNVYSSSRGQAVSVMRDLVAEYPCNGGAFFWVAASDPRGEWAEAVGSVVRATRGCSSQTASNPVTVSIPVPTPVPAAPLTTGGQLPSDSCARRVSAWGGCLSNPDCCEAGLSCYRQNQWWARCLRVCNYAPECVKISS